MPHPPIGITEDEGEEGFILRRAPVTGAPVYRPGSGVVAGNGTAEDPYVITGWATPAIYIEGTTAHVVVHNNTIGEPVTPSHGVYLNAVRNARLQDNAVTRGHTGVYLEDSAGVVLAGNTVRGTFESLWVKGGEGHVITDNTLDGGTVGYARLEGATNSTLANNTFRGEQTGLIVQDGGGHAILSNRFESTSPHWWAGIGMTLRYSAGNTVSGNVFDSRGIHMVGDALDHYLHDVDDTNRVAGKPIVYSANSIGFQAPAGAGQVMLVNTTGATVEGQAIYDADPGVLVAFSRNATVRDSHIEHHTSVGVRVTDSANITVASNELPYNRAGVVMARTAGGRVAENQVGSYEGVILRASDGVTVQNNKFWYGNVGVKIVGGGGNAVVENVMTGMGRGVHVAGPAEVHHNNIEGNGAGLTADVPVNATHNWWGCAEGPGAAGCDAVHGDATVDPWLMEPWPHAGAS